MKTKEEIFFELGDRIIDAVFDYGQENHESISHHFSAPEDQLRLVNIVMSAAQTSCMNGMIENYSKQTKRVGNDNS
jgi:hypothetical protein